MRTVKRIALALTAVAMIAGMPNAANATGYIRIGDKCYINVGVLISFPCPNEVSENP